MRTLSAFATSGDSFVKPILEHLGDDYECDLFRGQNVEHLLRADIIWCDWCDGMTAQISQITDRPMVVRFHSYELFTDFPDAVDWSKVHHLIFVAKHVQAAAHEKWPQLADVPQSVIPNSIDVPDSLPDREWTGKVAMVGTLSHKKGPGRLLEACEALSMTGQGYTFHLAGKMADERYRAVFEEAQKRLPLTLYGHVDDIPTWYADKDYILNASPWEGQACAVMEGAAAGCCPLVFAWPGAREVYPSAWIWTNVARMVNVAEARRTNAQSEAGEYARASRATNLRHVRDRFDSRIILPKIRAIVDDIDVAREERVEVLTTKPLVAAAMIVKNERKGLKKCLKSIEGIADEVFIFDTGSTDGTRKIATKMGAQVYTDKVPTTPKGRFHFGDARNVIIRKVPRRFKWILIIDGDEVLTDAGDIVTNLERNDVDALGVNVVSIGDDGPATAQAQPRLFLHGKIQYIYSVHNQPVGWESQHITAAALHAHYGGRQIEKAQRSIPILEEEHEADGANPRWSKLLAVTYMMLAAAQERAGEGHEESLRLAFVWARRCRDLAPAEAPHAENWPRLVRLTAQLAGLDAAEEVLREGLKHFPDLADLRYEQLVLTAFAWQHASVVAREKYPFVGQGTPRLVGRLPQAAQLLEMPMEFT